MTADEPSVGAQSGTAGAQSGTAGAMSGTAGAPAGRRSCKDGPIEDATTQIRLDPGSGERFVALRRQLGVSSFGINQIVLQPGQRGRIHRHERQEEVYLVLEGCLTLVIEAEPIELTEGELIRVAAPVRRQLVNRGPGRLVLLALGGDGEHQSRDAQAFAAWEQRDGVSPTELPNPADLDPADLRP